jgi:tetratricopeptide (TPR) repeat protein
MPQAQTCEECGTELPANAPEGLCLRCLAAMGLLLAGGKPVSGPDLPESGRESAIIDRRVRYFGDYELLEEVARGGMGIVYRARQVSLDRIVAVKMLLFGEFSSEDHVKRFRAEAEVAASLQHPNIVAIHEIGRHEGLHYFSMDYVPSRNLAELARNGPLPAHRAARYLKTIAQAVDYAHGRGVLHRDLKPSNVLIDETDEPRITDFGLAKRLNPVSELTDTGHILGSPSFMPPEQVDRTRGALGRHSDIYSLGALLYHVLTGRPAFVAETIEEILSQVLNVEPVSPRLLNGSVPRDLETICLKCMSKEPRARYGTAGEVAQELDCWLSGRPIRARATGVAEKIWRWSRRRPALAGLIGTALLLLLTVAFGSSLMFSREKQARMNEANLRLLAQASEKKAQSAADKSRQVALLWEHLLQGIGPATPLDTRRKILRLAAEHVRKDFAGQPETLLELKTALARAYHEMGMYGEMEGMAGEVLELNRSYHKEPDAAISAALCLLADALMHQHKLEDAEKLSRQALEMQRKLVGDAKPELFNPLNTLGVVLQREGKLDEAEETFREALKIKGLEGDSPERAALLENIAHVERDKHRFEEAERLFQEVLAIRRKLLGDEHQDVATSLHNLARVLYDEGRYPEAETMFGDVVARRRQLLGDEHPSVATSVHSLGLVLEAQGRWSEAESQFLKALVIRRKHFENAHPAVNESLTNLVLVLRQQGRPAEVDTLLRNTPN